MLAGEHWNAIQSDGQR